MKALTKTFVDYKGDVQQRQQCVQLNGRRKAAQKWDYSGGRGGKLIYTGQTVIRPVGAFTFHQGNTTPHHNFAQATWTDQYFIRKDWEQAVKELEIEGYDVVLNITDDQSYRELLKQSSTR
jgi:hypothetical protein